jgi:5-formyltetrahydrofolate cyclo-ligase
MTKQELREKYKALRKGLSNHEQDLISNQIKKHLLENFDLKGKKISCFVPIIRFNEINTWLILDGVDAKFYLPVIGSDDELKHVLYEGKDKLKESSWGILEPQSGEEIDASELDFVLVPLLTINKEGYRVGYGKGYYDKFLARCNSKCVFIGLYQFNNAEVIDDLHESDIAVHYCVTPKGLLGADNL